MTVKVDLRGEGPHQQQLRTVAQELDVTRPVDKRGSVMTTVSGTKRHGRDNGSVAELLRKRQGDTIAEKSR